MPGSIAALNWLLLQVTAVSMRLHGGNSTEGIPKMRNIFRQAKQDFFRFPGTCLTNCCDIVTACPPTWIAITFACGGGAGGGCRGSPPAAVHSVGIKCLLGALILVDYLATSDISARSRE